MIVPHVTLDTDGINILYRGLNIECKGESFSEGDVSCTCNNRKVVKDFYDITADILNEHLLAMEDITNNPDLSYIMYNLRNSESYLQFKDRDTVCVIIDSKKYNACIRASFVYSLTNRVIVPDV